MTCRASRTRPCRRTRRFTPSSVRPPPAAFDLAGKNAASVDAVPLAFAGCGGDDQQQHAARPEATPTQSEATPEATQAPVTFASPTDGQAVSGPVKVRVDLADLELDAENVGKEPEPESPISEASAPRIVATPMPRCSS